MEEEEEYEDMGDTEPCEIELVTCLLMRDTRSLNNVLADDGEFEIQNEDLSARVGTKGEFIHWIEKRMQEKPPSSMLMDFCAGCHKDKLVWLFDKGEFPAQPAGFDNFRRTALAFTVKDEKIVESKFCYRFQGIPNSTGMEEWTNMMGKMENMGVRSELASSFLEKFGITEFEEEWEIQEEDPNETTD